MFLDCKDCVFVLALDYNVVVSGIKSKYGDVFSADKGKGRSFFDKIIQVPFKMPVAQYNIHDFVRTEFCKVADCTCNEEDAKNLVELIKTSIGSNPRSMKRLFNSFLLLIKVTNVGTSNSGRQDEFCKKILFAILCLQLHFEDTYNHIVDTVLNKETIDAKFFVNLAGEAERSPDAEDGDALQQVESADYESDQNQELRDFMKCFNKLLLGESKSLDESRLSDLRELLRSSSVTATHDTAATKERATFTYKDKLYVARGTDKNNLGYLALHLIRDYAKEKDKTAEDIIEIVGSFPVYWTEMKKFDLKQICSFEELQLAKNAGAKKWYFCEEDDVLDIKGTRLCLSRGWGKEEIIKLRKKLDDKSEIT